MKKIKGILFIFSLLGVTAVWYGDISILDTKQYAPNPQIMINMATMYTVKDLFSLAINRRIGSSTVLHHVGVIVAYCYVLR